MKRVDDFRLRFGKQELVPIVIGGMGVDISTADLALEAARLGGVGHISDAMVKTVTDRRFNTKYVKEKLKQYKFNVANTDKSVVKFDLGQLAEATKLKCSLLISYHPVLFRPIKNIRATSADADALAYDAIRRSVSIYSPHTALDAAEGGTNDVLASLCGLNNVGPFEYVPAGSGECKIVTFVPPEAIDLVADAMFSAGGGRIGLYEKCSYRLRGRGTFFGTEATNPAVGRKGQLEYVDEIRLEMVVPQSRVPEVVEALNASHPYEVPAYDLYPLQGQPEQGIGRVGDLPSGMTLGALAKSLA